jgi:hypothetical protein
MCTGLLPPEYRGTFRLPNWGLSVLFPQLQGTYQGITHKDGTRPALPNFFFFCYECFVLCILLTVCEKMCAVLLPPGVNLTALKNKQTNIMWVWSSHKQSLSVNYPFLSDKTRGKKQQRTQHVWKLTTLRRKTPQHRSLCSSNISRSDSCL